MAKNNDIAMLQQQINKMTRQMQAQNAYKNSSIHKRMEKEAEKWFDAKVQERQTEVSRKQFIEDSMTRIMGGKPEHREVSLLKNVDGVLMRVNTNHTADVISVEPIKSFGELNVQERSQLMSENKRLYKLLQHEVYKPDLTERHIDMMINDGIKYEEWDMLAETPQRPNLEGLTSVESQNVLREYQTAKEAHDAKLNTYKADKEAYETGVMQQDLRDTEEKIQSLDIELSGDGE